MGTAKGRRKAPKPAPQKDVAVNWTIWFQMVIREIVEFLMWWHGQGWRL